MENPIYLGDGAYATMNDDGGVTLTANSHWPELATSAVYLDAAAVANFIKWIASA